MITGHNFIGQAQSAEGKKTYRSFNAKANTENEWVFYEATKKEIDAALYVAISAFEKYKSFSGLRKAMFLRAIAEEIEALGDELINTYVKESALPEGRARGERGRTIGQLNAFADLLEEGSWVEATIDTARPNREPLPRVDIRKMLVPIGPVAVFGSSNFPFAFSTAGGDTASALAAGCPVIVKSHPMHAATGELVASAILKAADRTNMPNGVFSNLNSSGIEVGQNLVMHPELKGVGFTGSTRAGTALYRMAVERDEPIPVFAEMGSINPVIALPSALKEKSDEWAAKYAGSIMLGAGQFCTNPGLILGLKGDLLDGFTKALGEEIEKLEPSCMLHPNIHSGYEEGKEKLSSDQDVNVVADYTAETAPNHAKQRVLKVAGSTFLKNPTLHQEVFGPFSIVVQCADENELIAVLKNLEGQLTGTVLGNSEELNSYQSVVSALRNKVGRIIFNGVPTGVEVCAAMQHGGPFPATTDSRFTSVGMAAIKRWARPVSFQNWPNENLPDELKDGNPLGITRILDNVHTKGKVGKKTDG